MSKNPKSNANRHWRRRNPPRFAIGDVVQVKPGKADPQFPDILMGGWVGTILDVEPDARPRVYHIEWNQKTLDAMPAIHRQRCSRENLAIDTIWLDEKDLAPFGEETAVIEQSEESVVRPLSVSKQDDRIRKIFGLTAEDALPKVHLQHLLRYRDYIREKISLPMQAFNLQIGQDEAVYSAQTVTIIAFDEKPTIQSGILCTVIADGQVRIAPLLELVLAKRLSNQFVDDYRYWIEKAEFDEEITTKSETIPASHDFEMIGGLASLAGFMLVFAALGGMLGMILGAMEYARISAGVAGLILGIAFYFLDYLEEDGSPGESGIYIPNRLEVVLLGIILGAFIGACLVAILGALPGFLFGYVLSRYLFKMRYYGMYAALAAILGGAIQAYFWDMESTLTFGAIGAGVGAILGTALSAKAWITYFRQERSFRESREADRA
jgi:hypothetical protein